MLKYIYFGIVHLHRLGVHLHRVALKLTLSFCQKQIEVITFAI